MTSNRTTQRFGASWSWRLPRTALSVSTVLLALALATGSSAAGSPKAGCWGTCGGPAGPLAGVFIVKGAAVTSFEYSEACLGTTSSGTDYLHILKALAVSKSGAFTYNGSAIVSNLASAKRLYAVAVTVAGMFKSATMATVTIATAHGGCAKKHLSMRFVG